MPGPTFIHIQSRDDTSIRVVELAKGPVRIGRGELCEVRLDDPKLGEVQCILRDRGNSWSFQPVGPTGHIWIDGRPADVQGPIRMGVPFRVGDHWLTLRSAENAFNDYGSFASPITVEARPEPAPESSTHVPPSSSTSTSSSADDRLDRWQSRLDQRERWVKDRQDEKRWEARWKAAGETIRNKSTAAPTPPPTPQATPVRPPVPPSSPRSRPAPPELRPVARIVEPRPTEPIRRAPEPVRTPVTVKVRPVPPSTPTPIPTLPSPQPAEPAVSTSRAIVCLPSTKPPTCLTSEIAPSPMPVEAEPERSVETRTIEPETPVFLVPSMLPEPSPEPEPIAASPASLKAEPARPAISEPPRLDPPPSTASTPQDWPSARTIFASQGSRTAPAAAPVVARKRRATAPEPTESLAPARWTLPLWVGWLPTTAFVLLAGGASLGLAADWAQEANAANLAIRAATRAEGTAGPRLDPANIPRGGWWRSTAPHLSAWALAMVRATDGEDHSEDLRMLMDDARHASHLASNTRFVVEPPASADLGADAGFAHLGRPREVLTLAWTGRRLKRAGKVEASLKAYRASIEMASRVEPGNLEAPAFVDDTKTQARRYLFLHEGLIRLVVRDMAEAGDWSIEQWTATLPDFAVAPLAAAIEIRAKDRVGSDQLLDLAIARGDGPQTQGTDAVEHLAATAEAMAIRSRWTDSADRYRRAIEAEDDDASRRMWWLNLADVARRSNDDKLRARAIEAAKAPESGDEITRRAVGIQQSLASPVRTRAGKP